MDRYLSKPLSIEQLRAALESPTAPVDARANAGPEPPGPETLDVDALERIRDLNMPGQPDLLERLAVIYASSSVTLVEVLRRAALTGDAAGLRQAAHGLKSSSQNVGATKLAAICQEVELAAEDSRLEVAEELVDRLIREHEHVLQSLGQKAVAASG